MKSIEHDYIIKDHSSLVIKYHMTKHTECHDVVHNAYTDASVNFENDFVCNFLNKSEPSCLLEMVLSIITSLSLSSNGNWHSWQGMRL